MATRKGTGSRRTPNPHLALADEILNASGSSGGRHESFGHLPAPAEIGEIVDELLAVLFPGWGRPAPGHLREHVAEMLAVLETRLEQVVTMGTRRRREPGDSDAVCRDHAHGVTGRFLRALPEIRALLVQDVEAHFRSDPAATGIDEVVSCYPGLYAIAIYRAAHRLLLEGAQIVPRMMTEHAHARTGIDIHPGAVIGPSFFIDHGTGIVIGETTVIGRSVRIYQGVTLGALSIKRRDLPARAPSVRKRRGVPAIDKRHPTIEDEVIIYANATILGGTTVIGKGAVIGGNAWITYSVPAGVRVGVGT